MLTASDVIQGSILTEEEVMECLKNAMTLIQSMKDRKDLHERAVVERFNNILMGELAERAVISWLHSQGKYAESAVDKQSGVPDKGYDVKLKNKDGVTLKCSVKSSLSASISDMGRMLTTYNVASKESEIQGINIQVYFWLDLNPGEGKNRITVPSEWNMAIIGWAGRKEMSAYASYNHEDRQRADKRLSSLHPMTGLLDILS